MKNIIKKVIAYRRKEDSKRLQEIRDQVLSDIILKPYITDEQRDKIVEMNDPVRYGTIFLAMDTIQKENITGDIAECGVWRGYTSKFLHELMPGRQLYLFDTFSGFDTRDSDTKNDDRFMETSEEEVLKYIGDSRNLVVRKGYFPESAAGLEKEKFAFVMADFDKYDPTLAALEFFYTKVTPGGFIFVHDYNSPESDWACSKAVSEFLKDKPEKIISIPDTWGTGLFRKV